MNKTHYTWYTIDVIEQTGLVRWEVKALNEDHAIRQIKDRVREQNLRAENTYLPVLIRGGRVLEVLWDTLQVDRIGYQRLS